MSRYRTNVFLYRILISILGLTTYLNTGFDIDIPPNQFWYCTAMVTVLSSSSMSSTYLIVAMTFERFYSIIKPHKAASFNTLKRAKITIVCIAVLSAVYSIPHLFMTTVNGRTCVVYYNEMKYLAGRIYY